MRPSAAGVAVAASARSLSLYDPALHRRATLDAQGAIEDVAWSPTGRAVAIIDEDGLRVVDVTRDGLRWRVVGRSYACHFTADGEALWVARPTAHGNAAGQGPGAWIELRDAHNGALLARRYLADPFDGAAFTLAPHPHPRGILVWLAAADGAACSIVVTATGRELGAELLPFEHGYPPEPIWGTEHFLVAGSGGLERRQWQTHQVSGVLEWPWLDDSPLAVLPFDQRHALWVSHAGRVHLIDCEHMAFLDELELAGYPPMALPDPEAPHEGHPLHQLCAVGELVVLQFGEHELVAVTAAGLLADP